MLFKWYELNPLSPFPAEAPPLDGVMVGVAVAFFLLVAIVVVLARSAQAWMDGNGS